MSFAKLKFPPLSYVGQGLLNQLLEEGQKFKPTKIALITDPVLMKIGVVEKIVTLLQEARWQVWVFSEVVAEPPLELAEKLVSLVRTEQSDLVIGLGGGSALDLAKLVAVLSVHEGNVADYLNLTGTKTISKKGLPKILLPTTSGTGSEVTNISVLSLESTKDVVAHDYLLADVALVDADLTITVPPRVTAATGMDALTHAIEAYLSVNASPATDALALHAIRLASSSLQRAVDDGNDIEARLKMSQASYLAGLAFFNAGVAAVHALAYPLGGQFQIPHGEANSVLLPYVMKYIRDSCSQKFAEIMSVVDRDSLNFSFDSSADQFIEYLLQMVQNVGLPSKLVDYGIPESSLESLARDAEKQTRLLSRSPMPLKYSDVSSIYRAAFTGSI